MTDAKSSQEVVQDSAPIGPSDVEFYKDEETVRYLRDEKGMSYSDLSALAGVSDSAVAYWWRKFETPDRGFGEEAYKDKGVLEQLYLDEEMGLVDVSNTLDCAMATVRNWLIKHDIPMRSYKEAKAIAHRDTRYLVKFQPAKSQGGHEVWYSNSGTFPVHRLQAVSIFGTDAVKGMHVHHKNGIPWDNRDENLELLTPSEHHASHFTFDWLDKLRVTEMYENTDCSYRDIGRGTEMSAGTARRFHREVMGLDA